MGERKEMGWEKGSLCGTPAIDASKMPKRLDPQEGGPLGGEGLDPSPLPERHEKPGHEGDAPTPSRRGGGGADALRPAPLLRMVQSSRR